MTTVHDMTADTTSEITTDTTTNGAAAETTRTRKPRATRVEAEPSGIAPILESLRAARADRAKTETEAEERVRALIKRMESNLAELYAELGEDRDKEAVNRAGAKLWSPATRRPKASKPSAAKPAGARLPRRNEAQIKLAASEVAAKVKAAGDKGMRSEAIKAALGLTAKELPAILKEALSSKLLRKTGVKRATVYTATAKA